MQLESVFADNEALRISSHQNSIQHYRSGCAKIEVDPHFLCPLSLSSLWRSSVALRSFTKARETGYLADLTTGSESMYDLKGNTASCASLAARRASSARSLPDICSVVNRRAANHRCCQKRPREERMGRRDAGAESNVAAATSPDHDSPSVENAFASESSMHSIWTRRGRDSGFVEGIDLHQNVQGPCKGIAR